MRYIAIGFCVFAAACARTSPTAPTSSALTSASSQMGGGSATEANGGSELPFKGTYEGLEIVVSPSIHRLDNATGNATHLGRFTVTAEWALGAAGGAGASKWTAADGDEFSTNFARHGVPAPPTITFTETHIITGGTGRFANASGSTFTVVQVRGLSMPYNNSATIDGTIDLGR